MLVLTRKVNESILIGDDIVVTILEMNHNSVRVAIKAPIKIPILREELLLRKYAPSNAMEEDS